MITSAGAEEACNVVSDKSPEDLASEITAAIDDVGRPASKSSFTTPEMAYEAFTNPDARDDALGLQSGLVSLDNVTGGFFKAEMTILAARPSMGKSGIGAQIALNVVQAGKGFLFISLEMPSAALYNRIYTSMSWSKNDGIAYSDIRKDKLHVDQRQRLDESAFVLTGHPLIVEDRRGIKVQQLPAIIRRARRDLEARG